MLNIGLFLLSVLYFHGHLKQTLWAGSVKKKKKAHMPGTPSPQHCSESEISIHVCWISNASGILLQIGLQQTK